MTRLHNLPRSACAATLLLLGVSACQRPAEPPPPRAPRLVLLVVVDQMRADYLERFASKLDGGLSRLLSEGVVFADAHHDHAATSTAPGHASLATGCHPARHGIISNYWFDRATGDLGYALEDESPKRLLCPTLGERLKARYPRAKVFAASQKDRSAVMLAGRKADGVFWYDWEGGFRTSSFYSRRVPDWVTAFNEEKAVHRHFGTAWTVDPLAPEEEAALGLDTTSLGWRDFDFPHAYGRPRVVPGESFYESLYWSPTLDEQVARLAVRAVYAEGLGEDEWPDLLALGFSALDMIGHRYGPESREVLETVLALDETLGWLLDQLDQKVGLEHVLIALSSDHGVAPVAERRQARGEPDGRRVGADQVLCLQRLESGLDERLGSFEWLLPGGFINPAAVAERNVETQAIEKVVEQILGDCPAVARVWLRSRLMASASESESPAERRFRNSYHPGRSPDFLIQWERYFVPTRSALATHGSVYDYDTHVPLALRVPGVAPRVRTDPVRTVDLAPTLAALLDVDLDGIDGRDLAPGAGR